MKKILIIEDKPHRIAAFKEGLAKMDDQFDVEVVNSYKHANKSIASNKRIDGIIDGMSDTFPNELEQTNAYASLKGNCINEDVKYMIVPNEGQNNLQFSIHSIQRSLSKPIKIRPKGGYLMEATIRNLAKKLEYSEANTIEERVTDATSSGVQKDSGDQKQKGLQISAQTIRDRLSSNIEGASVFNMACGILKENERKKYAPEIALIKEGYEKKNKKTLLDLIAIDVLDKLV